MGRKKKESDSQFSENKVHWYNKLRDKYRLIILNEDTFEEKLTFRLSRLNVFIVIGMLAIIFIFLTTYIIAFTPLKEYIPGYNDTGVQEELYELTIHADSIEKAMKAQALYIDNMRKIATGNVDIINEKDKVSDTINHDKYSNITLKKSKEDSLLRAEYEQSNKYSLLPSKTANNTGNSAMVGIPIFFTPVKGIITNPFNVSAKHFGVDVAAPRNEAIKAVYDGTVIFSEWSSATGHVIAIQHINNVISVYKHNSVILKKQGSFVKAGESVAIIGDSGEYTTGPHLHFELWMNGSPVDPQNFVIFK